MLVSTFIHGYVIWPHVWKRMQTNLKEKEIGARMRQVSTVVMVVGVGCAFPCHLPSTSFGAATAALEGPVPMLVTPPGARMINLHPSCRSTSRRRPTCSAASSPVRPRPRRRRHSCCLGHSWAIRWCSHSPTCSSCCWAVSTIAPGLLLAAAEHVDFLFNTGWSRGFWGCLPRMHLAI